MRVRKTILFVLIAVSAMVVVSSQAFAAGAPDAVEEFPTREITVVATFAAGGGVDTYTRGLVATAEKYLGQPMVVRNVTGAGGATGAIEVYRSAPDGYTLMSIDSSLTTLEVFRGDDLPFRVEEFEPIGAVMYSPTWIISNTAQTYSTIHELIEAARARPGEVSMGTAGPAGSQYLMARAFESALDLDLNIIPYDGGGTLMAQLAGDHADSGVIHTPVGLDYVEAGEIAVLAVGGPDDAVVYDLDVPTFDDLGVPMEFMVYRGLFAPPGTPQEIVDILAEAVRQMAEAPEFEAFGERWGVRPTYYGPEEFRALLQRDYETFMSVYGELVR